MYVWHTGSFTSSSRRAGADAGARSQRVRSVGRTATTTSTTTIRNKNERIPSTTGIWPDREGPEEIAVLLGELEPLRGFHLGAGEEDTRLGAAPQDLLHGIARRLRRAQRELDGAQQLVHQPVDMAVLRHGPYDNTRPDRNPIPGSGEHRWPIP